MLQSLEVRRLFSRVQPCHAVQHRIHGRHQRLVDVCASENADHHVGLVNDWKTVDLREGNEGAYRQRRRERQAVPETEIDEVMHSASLCSLEDSGSTALAVMLCKSQVPIERCMGPSHTP